jgi:glycosyltransferase involved in cell wall biosynthesis
MVNVSVIIPAKNEEVTLPFVLTDLQQVTNQIQNNIEIICVNDHSTDSTAEIARSFNVKVINNSGKSGKGMALRQGFEAATGEIFVCMDADYSHRAEELPSFLDALKNGIGLVIGSRVAGGSEEYTHIRALGNILLSASFGLATGRYLSDALNGYKAFRRDVFTDFRYTSTSFEIEVELIANALRKGYRVVEVVSHERARAGGKVKSKVLQHGFRFFQRILLEGIRGINKKNAADADHVKKLK